MADKTVESCLNINRRMPPMDVDNTLNNLIMLADGGEALEDRLVSAIDCPLEVANDPKASCKYIKCDYNRDGDSYRSPKSNEYFPPFDAPDKFMPSPPTRKLEERCNQACDVYRDLYHDGGVSSVYCWDMGDGAWACCWAVVKNVSLADIKSGKKSSNLKDAKEANLHWSEIHVFEVTRKNMVSGASKPEHKYKLTSTAIVHINKKDKKGVKNQLSGNRTIQKTVDAEIENKKDPNGTHVVTMGKMVEECATALLNTMNNVFFGKMNTVLSRLHQNQKDQNKGLYDSLAKDLKKTLQTAPA